MNKRIFWIDLLRIWATFCVIIAHVQSAFYWDAGIETLGGQEQVIIVGITVFSVPIFLMLSGTIWLHKKEVVELKPLWNKILKLLTALAFWSVFYAIYNESNNAEFDAYRLLKNILCGNYHLWFMYMFIGVYMVIPMLQQIAKNKKLLIYTTILAGIFACLIPTLRNIRVFAGSEIFNIVVSQIDYKFVLGGNFYFVLGYVMDEFISNNKRRHMLMGTGFVALCVSFILAYYERVTGSHSFNWYGTYTINILLYNVGVFAAFKREYHVSDKIKNLVHRIAEHSLGIYLIHDFVKSVVNKKFFALEINIPESVAVFIISVIVFLISLFITWIIKKIPKVNRYIV